MLLPDFLFSNNADSPSYIKKFKDIAIREMQRSGIPASITLAQAIHESAWGNGKLALNSNNYFGIKCKDYWTGPTYYIEDDDYEAGRLVKSCFRAYDNVEGSFVDHSNFLVDNPRYKILFQYEINDYRNWAKGLQKCGYATDKKYAAKLIRTIEQYQLYQYDTLIKPSPQVMASAPTSAPVADAPRFDLSGFVTSATTTTTVQNTTTSPATTTLLAEETYDIPEAFVLPDDYERGANKTEGQTEEPLILGSGTWPAVSHEVAPLTVPPPTPAPAPYQAATTYTEEAIEAPRPQHPIAEKPSTRTTAPVASEAIIRMTYVGDAKAAQLSRKPRVSSNKRR